MSRYTHNQLIKFTKTLLHHRETVAPFLTPAGSYTTVTRSTNHRTTEFDEAAAAHISGGCATCCTDARDREMLGLETVPHFTTLQKFFQRERSTWFNAMLYRTAGLFEGGSAWIEIDGTGYPSRYARLSDTRLPPFLVRCVGGQVLMPSDRARKEQMQGFSQLHLILEYAAATFTAGTIARFLEEIDRPYESLFLQFSTGKKKFHRKNIRNKPNRLKYMP